MSQTVVEEAAANGRLEVWSTVPHRTSEIWVLRASRRLASTKVTAFVDFIAEELGQRWPADRVVRRRPEPGR